MKMAKLFEFFFLNPYKIIFSFIFISIFSLYFSIENLKINTSTDSLIDNNLEFKKDQKKLNEQFQILSNNILIRISSEQTDKIKLVYDEINQKLENKKEIDFFYSPNFDEFFRENFFLLLNEEQKENFVDELYKFQPFLSEINDNPKIKGFNDFIELLIKSEKLNSIGDLEKIFKIFVKSLEDKKNVEWKSLLDRDLNEIFILISMNKNHLENHGFAKFYNFLNSLNEKYDDSNMDLSFTGGLVIDHEELRSVSSGAMFSGFLSLILVSLILFFAFRKIKLIIFLTLSIFIGLIITTGLTTLVVGSLNLISVAFAVLFIGVSVDFGIQVYLRILEKKESSNFISSIRTISKTITIAAIPSIIGFLSFIPTNYIGLSELGIISAIGLLTGLLVNIFLLPSFLLISKNKNEFRIQENIKNYNWSIFFKLIKKYRSLILSVFFIIAIFDFYYFKSLTFDSDALKLKDQDLQSVKLAKELIEKNPTSDYVISILSDNVISNDKIKKILSDDNIKSIKSLDSLLENYESDNLDYLKILFSSNKSEVFFSDFQEINRLKNLLNKVKHSDDQNLSAISDKLIVELSKSEINKTSAKEIENILFKNFNEVIDFILNLGEKPNFKINEMPDYYKKRYESSEGFKRIEVLPSKDVKIHRNLEEFVFSVKSIFPNATGMPVIQIEAGKVVVNSFIFAFTISFIFTLVFLTLIFRDYKKVIICLSSLFVALVLLVFLMILFNINLNFANMISLPLLFSLGISYPIYFVSRLSETKDLGEVFNSNTPLAILCSALTTIASFGTLYFSSHDGTSSMGLLLFLSLSTTLISSLIFLPIIALKINPR